MQQGTDTAPIVVGTLQALATVTAAVSVTFAQPSSDRSVLVATGILLIGTVGLVGLFLARGKWARRVLAAALGFEALIYIIFGTWWIGLVISAVAAVGLGMPKLDGWVRQLAKVNAPPTSGVMLPLGLVTMPLIVGLSRDPAWFDWTFVALSVVAGWSYGRAHQATLWIIRFAYLPLGLTVAFAPFGWSTVVIAAATIGLGVVAWSPGALAAVQSLEPRRMFGKPVFAEMAPPGLMDEIGRDSRGRKRP